MSEIHIEFDRETDGRWIAECVNYPGVMSYGKTRADALRNVVRLLISVMRQEDAT